MSKYYTPSIEEFHIGLRYEVNEDHRQEGWVKYTVKHYNDMKYCVNEDSDSEYRVKYLDKEDIEELGWKFNGTLLDFGTSSYSKDGHLLFYYKTNGKSEDPERVKVMYNNRDRECIFDGTIKNYNELKRLMTQIGII